MEKPVYLENNVAELMREKLRTMGQPELPPPTLLQRLSALAIGVFK